MSVEQTAFMAPKHRVFVATQLLAVVSVLTLVALWFFGNWLPSPGISVVVIAAIAAVMSIHGEMNGKHKALWMLIIGAFAVLELLAIRHADVEQAEHQKKVIEEEREHFSDIGDGIKAAIKQSQDQFKATMQKTSTVLDTTQSVGLLAKKNLLNVTGGDSFAYVSPQSFGGDQFPGIVWNNGEQPLTGLTLTIAHTSDPIPVWGAAFYQPIFIGTVGPHDHAPIPGFLFRPKASPTSAQDNYWIMLSAQNGTVSQSVYFRRDKRHPDVWAFAFTVTKQTDGGKPQERRLEMKPSDIPKKSRIFKNKILLYRAWSDDLIEDSKKDEKK